MGNENRLFYYPYASFNSDQIPLLKVAALYFDQLVLLDPEAASWARIGADPAAQAAVRLLAGEGLLESVSPAETLAAYQGQILDAVREDMSDQQFLSLCETRQGIDARGRWTLALAKVPQALRQDQVMREVLGDAAREIARQTGYTARDYVEHIEALSYLPGNTQQVPQVVVQRAHTYDDYSSTGIVFDEGNRADHPGANYRYVDLPLALGESIMVNHAIFTGLVQQQAVPITDDPFHSTILKHKINRGITSPRVREMIDERLRERGVKTNVFVATTLRDADLQLPALDPTMPLEEILEYRQAHQAELGLVRKKLERMARRIEGEPWSDDFAHELEHRTIPDLIDALDDARKARDSWLESKRRRLGLSGLGLAGGAASVVLGIIAAPVTPIALAVAALSLTAGTVVPGLEWLQDWRDGRQAAHENGLHYLLTTR